MKAIGVAYMSLVFANKFELRFKVGSGLRRLERRKGTQKMNKEALSVKSYLYQGVSRDPG